MDGTPYLHAMYTTRKIHTENADFQILEALRCNRTKRNHVGEFFVEGVRAITQVVVNGWNVEALVFSREKRLSDWAVGIIENSGAKIYFELPLRLMAKLSQKVETSEMIALVRMPDDDLMRITVHERMLVIVLDRPSNPGNLGAIIRSCDALGVDGMIVSGHAADLYDPETIRATTGSFFCVPAVRLSSPRDLLPWLESLRQRFSNLQVVGTSAKANIPIFAHDFTAPTVLLMGNETNGLSHAYQSVCDDMIIIPMVGYASSFNLACAASILLYEAARQRGRLK